ncbi:FKBP-type peptidyl-prolyl cis-trans isomerase [Bdellovibrio svalbardensis]|uniref:Peptidyl-prolyl cis-trans isomerase n=1 Tax=Bdellovibrio svalbardensis TaxID=2972972 RepID=A0ABT6DJY4_9BACT|nr:peptidylprolyl isomerase [Bdellovibrio svalbardensis]MDG0817178.1 peptidylprolyl isomerase [Bdellovibrio svalbardensis]
MRRVLAFNYVLKGPDGAVLDASEQGQPLPFLEGAGQILPKLEEEIKDLKEGDKKTVKLEAKDAYGEVRDNMFMEVPKEELAHLPQLEIGAHLRLELSGGAHIVRVSKITDTHVTLDGNHPLAGQPLEFAIEMVLIREATAEELQHGHPHGLHGDAGHHHGH